MMLTVARLLAFSRAGKARFCLAVILLTAGSGCAASHSRNDVVPPPPFPPTVSDTARPGDGSPEPVFEVERNIPFVRISRRFGRTGPAIAEMNKAAAAVNEKDVEAAINALKRLSARPVVLLKEPNCADAAYLTDVGPNVIHPFLAQVRFVIKRMTDEIQFAPVEGPEPRYEQLLVVDSVLRRLATGSACSNQACDPLFFATAYGLWTRNTAARIELLKLMKRDSEADALQRSSKAAQMIAEKHILPAAKQASAASLDQMDQISPEEAWRTLCEQSRAVLTEHLPSFFNAASWEQQEGDAQ